MRASRVVSDAATEARYRPPDVRRQQILDAAAMLAKTDGLERTSIARVAEAAGLAKGSIYLHFESRQELISALQAQVWAEMIDTPRRILANEDMFWTERLDAVVEHWMQYESEHVELYHAVFHAVATDNEEPWDDARALLREVIAGGAATGEFDVVGLDPDVVVEFLLHAYTGPCFHHGDIDAAIGNVQQLFRRAVGARPGT